MQAQSAQQPFLETFAAMLQDELDRRRSRLTERRFKHSKLDERPTLADFDWRFNPKLPRQACSELHTLKFIADRANALIICKPGVGKTHLIAGIGHALIDHGYKVLFVRTSELVQRLQAARRDLRLPGELAKLDRFDLIIWTI